MTCLLFGVIYNLSNFGWVYAVDSSETIHSPQLPPGFIVDVTWLNQNYKNGSVVVVDVREPTIYSNGHISGAVSIPVQSTFSSKSDNEIIAPISHIQQLLSESGIDNETNIVLYDDGEYVNAARVFWVLEVYGHKKVSILDGGFPLWQLKSLPTSDTNVKRQPSIYVPTIVPEILSTKFSTRLAISDETKQIIDARSNDEYIGRKSITERFGHIPNSINIPSSLNYKNIDGINIIKTIDELNGIYKDIDSSKKVIAYCNKGKESALTYLILRRLGYRVSAYDGSWLEWSRDPTLPVISSP